MEPPNRLLDAGEEVGLPALVVEGAGLLAVDEAVELHAHHAVAQVVRQGEEAVLDAEPVGAADVGAGALCHCARDLRRLQ